jgi:hypothetical protein
MAANNPGVNMGTTGSLHDIDWETEDAHWRDEYASRPYAQADRSWEYYRPAYHYGAESAHRWRDRDWNAAESDLRTGWDKARGASESTWDEVKHAVRDAWDRVRGRPHR